MKKQLDNKVSIITICFNNAKGIIKTADSIANQNNQNYEWIVVDGGSTDGTLEILEKYKKNISVLVSEKDKGIYDAMNKGIQLAAGEYLLFLNAGDRFYDDSILAWFYRTSEKSDIVIGNALFEEGGAFFENSVKKVDERYFMCGNFIPHQASFIKRDLFNQYGLYDCRYKIAADHEFFMRVILKYNVSVHCHDEFLAKLEDGGLSKKRENKFISLREVNRIKFKYLNIIKYLKSELLYYSYYRELYYEFKDFIKSIFLKK